MTAVSPHIRIHFTGEKSRADMVHTLTTLGVIEITDDPAHEDAVTALFTGEPDRIADLHGVGAVTVLDASSE
jgi:hypothetical protein